MPHRTRTHTHRAVRLQRSGSPSLRPACHQGQRQIGHPGRRQSGNARTLNQFDPTKILHLSRGAWMSPRNCQFKSPQLPLASSSLTSTDSTDVDPQHSLFAKVSTLRWRLMSANSAELDSLLRPFYAKDVSLVGEPIAVFKSLLAILGQPHESFRPIHIVGTSGKTSTGYFLHAILSQAGILAGLSVSPHVACVSERAQVGAGGVSPQEILEPLGRYLRILQLHDFRPGYFSVVLGFAFWLFRETHVSIAIVEAGVGGITDRTSVLNSSNKVCVVTDIGEDHLKTLGPSVSHIIANKIGVVCPGNRVFVWQQPKQILDQVLRRAHALGGVVTVVADGLPVLPAPLGLPPFQFRNWCLAARTAQEIVDPRGWAALVSDLSVRPMTYSNIQAPGRAEVFNLAGQTYVVDGAHNGQKMRAVADALIHLGSSRESTSLIFNILEKRMDSLPEMADIAGKMTNLTIVPCFDAWPRQACQPAIVVRALPSGIRKITASDVHSAIHLAQRQDRPLVLVTGSLYLAGACRTALLDLGASRPTAPIWPPSKRLARHSCA
jgi:dihydrofolate synthase/folylpolyglutamate synthase